MTTAAQRPERSVPKPQFTDAEAGAQEFPGAMGVGVGVGVGVMGAPGPSSVQQGQEGFADADNTLAMWSSAPSDFQ